MYCAFLRPVHAAGAAVNAVVPSKRSAGRYELFAVGVPVVSHAFPVTRPTAYKKCIVFPVHQNSH